MKHGNGVETTREYDRDLERLTRIFTRQVNTSTTHFQDLTYAYDPAGNPMQITDNLSSSSFSHNQIMPNTRTFGYDPRYRLIRATGKKHRTVRRKDTDVLVTSPDPNDYKLYTITYDYDAAGNFTRNQEYTGGELHYKSGRLDLFNGDRTEAGSFSDPEEGNFRYDANGNTSHTPRHEELAYTFDNQVRYVDRNGGGQVHYFRHGDQRVLRLVKKNGVKALTIYLGLFEYHLRKAVSGYTKLVLQVQGHGRHAQAERILAGSDPRSLNLFFHHSDLLGSGHVLTKYDGDLLSQEEYFPYGRASDRRDARNRYRFIGRERDEDTGLCMAGPRTYDPVSGRFLQGDPISVEQVGKTPYHYASGSPIGRMDANGYQDTSESSGGVSMTPEQSELWKAVDQDPTNAAHWEQLYESYYNTPAKGRYSTWASELATVRWRAARAAYEHGYYFSATQNTFFAFTDEVGARLILGETALGTAAKIGTGLATGLLLGKGLSLAGAYGKQLYGSALQRFLYPAVPYRFANLGGGVLGEADKWGNISIQSGLRWTKDFWPTLRHEAGHRFLSPGWGPGSLTNIRATIGMWGYKNSHLLRFLEEGFAESYAVLNPLKGFSFASGYISGGRLLLEGAIWGSLVGGTGAYLGYELSTSLEQQSEPEPTP